MSIDRLHQERMVSRKNASPGNLHLLRNSEHVHVRLMIGRHPKTQGRTIEDMSTDPEPKVAQVLVIHRNVTVEALQRLMRYPDEYVSQAAERKFHSVTAANTSAKAQSYNVLA